MCEERLAAVQTRLERVSSARDLSPVLEPSALSEAHLLAEVLDDDGDLEVRYLLGWLHWFRYLALPEGHDREDLDAAVQAFMP